MGDLGLVTFNCTSWASFKRAAPAFAADPAVHVICAQETHINDEHKWAAAASFMLGLGFTGVHNEAFTLESGLSTGGAAIFSRNYLGARVSAVHDALLGLVPEHRGRIAAITVPLLGTGELDIVSIYLEAGSKLAGINVDMLEALGTKLPNRQVVLAGDFNMDSQLLQDSGFLDTAGLAVRKPPPDQPTCRSTAGTYSHIDYYLVSTGIADLSGEAASVAGMAFNPHVPVKLLIRDGLVERWVRSWVRPGGIPTKRCLGHCTISTIRMRFFYLNEPEPQLVKLILLLTLTRRYRTPSRWPIDFRQKRPRRSYAGRQVGWPKPLRGDPRRERDGCDCRPCTGGSTPRSRTAGPARPNEASSSMPSWPVFFTARAGCSCGQGMGSCARFSAAF